MSNSSRELKPRGQKGEEEAVKHLKSQGYRILERNWKKRYGEVDIVAQDGEFLVFVEVKARQGEKYGRPEEAMSSWKISSLIRCANYYKILHPEFPEALRIDFVGIIMKGERVKEINLIKNITG